MYLFLLYDRANKKVAEVRSPTLEGTDLAYDLYPVFRSADAKCPLRADSWVLLINQIQQGMIVISVGDGYSLDVIKPEDCPGTTIYLVMDSDRQVDEMAYTTLDDAQRNTPDGGWVITRTLVPQGMDRPNTYG